MLSHFSSLFIKRDSGFQGVAILLFLSYVRDVCLIFVLQASFWHLSHTWSATVVNPGSNHRAQWGNWLCLPLDQRGWGCAEAGGTDGVLQQHLCGRSSFQQTTPAPENTRVRECGQCGLGYRFPVGTNKSLPFHFLFCCCDAIIVSMLITPMPRPLLFLSCFAHL